MNSNQNLNHILATVDTGSMQWTALGLTAAECDRALIEAYAEHVLQTPHAQPGLMTELIEIGEVNYSEIKQGQALRDGSPLVKRVAPMNDHNPTECLAVECETCIEAEQRESVVRLELAILDLETSPEGAAGAWIDSQVVVDALDVQNVLDLLRG